jgi:uncharacterized protein (DUF433 family)
MLWQDWITSDPGVLGGKPAVRGTRLSVVFLLGLLAQGWSQDQVLENYPQLTDEALRAALSYAQQSLEQERFIALSSC